MRILITGGAGFIGSNLTALAIERGVDVTVLDDLSTGHRENVDDSRARFVHGSILDRDALRESLDDVDTIVHLAALGSVPRSIADPVASHAANATGTLTVLEEARRAGVEHLVISSSSSVYGANPSLPRTERDWVRPMSPYAVTKLAAEQYVLAYQQSFGMQTLAFRFFNVYGPGQRPGHTYAAVVPIFVDAILNRRPLPINGDGSQSRDFTYVGTVCQVLLEAATSRVTSPEPVNLAFGTNSTIHELIGVIADCVGRQPEVVYREPRPGDVMHSQADNSVLRSLFPHVEPTPLQEGIRSTLDWFGARK